MLLIDKLLEPPSYGWTDINDKFYKPTKREVICEFFKRINIFRDRKNWLAFFCWFNVFCFFPFFILFVVSEINNFNIWHLIFAFIYTVMLATHGTIWYHRYCTHQAYTFRNKFWCFITQHLVIKVITEEIYVVSHHVHHAKSDQPGDPYNAQGGFWYCFFADTNHQPIARNLKEHEYSSLLKLTKHIGIKENNYCAYLKLGSIASPFKTMGESIFNWLFWYAAFYLIGGHILAITLFGATWFWALGVRTFNYKGHGKGKDKRREGVDYNKKDMSVNQLWPGIIAGEWHNNHHLYPASARSGFLPYQIDFPWYFIKGLSIIGAITSYHDSKNLFIENYRKPFLQKNIKG